MLPISSWRLSLVLLVLCPTVGAEPAAEHPNRGGVLHVAQRAEPKTLNPITATDAPSREVIQRIHSDLITIDRSTQKTVPALAESWKQLDGGTRYVLKLRKGVKFSDGKPFTADDVVFSWSLYLDEGLHAPQRDLLLIDGQPIRVSKVDDLTVAFQLSKPYAAAERLFDSIAMLPRHRLEATWKAGKLRGAWGLNTAPAEIVGLGPFRFKEHRPGEAVVLERNPYYWKAGADGANLPYLDGIEFRLLPDEDMQLARFVSGDLDILNRLSMKSISYLQSKGAQITDMGPGLEYNFLCFNLSPGSSKLSWFGSREFRLAISAVADREAMAKLVYQGKASPLWGHVSPGNRLWYSNQIPHPARSIANARQLLTKGGFRWNSKGRLVDGSGAAVEFSILVSSSSPERQQMATLLQSDLDQIGISVNITALEFRSVLDRVLNTRQFDTVLLGLGGGDADPNPEMNVWLSSGGSHFWNPNQKTPATKWETEVDDLMKQQMVTVNLERRKKLYDRVQQVVAEQSPMIFLVSPNVVVAQRGSVGNFRPAVLNHFTLWNAGELFLRKGGPSRQ